MLGFLLVGLLLLKSDNGQALEDNEQKVLYLKTKWRFCLEENGRRMVLTTQENGKIQDCYAFGDRNLISAVLRAVPYIKIVKVDTKTMTALTNYCTYAKWSRKVDGTSGEEVWMEFGIFSGMFIYPGTKWCGAGNVSESYDDLGPEVEADLCCRDHDHCNDSIDGFDSKYELDNNSPFTRSHCDCDDKFQQCLRKANTRASNRIGKLFFNYIQMRCFKNEHPIIGCDRYKGFFRPRCQEYVLDKDQDPIWQFFDAKHYVPITDDDNEIEDRYRKDVFEYILKMSSENYYQTELSSNKTLHKTYSVCFQSR